MPRWVVEYWGRTGRDRMLVSAHSHKAVRQLSGVPASRVINISKDWSSLAMPEFAPRRPSPKTQLLFLVRAQAMCASFGRVAVADLVKEFGELRRIAKSAPQVWREDLDLSRRLEYLRFDAVVVVLIITGEKTGTLRQSLRVATRYVKIREAVKGETSSQVSLGLLLFVLGALSFFMLPLILSEPLRGLQNIRGIDIQTTWATDLLFGMNFLVGQHPVATLALLAGVVVAIGWGRQYLRWLWPFGLMEKLSKNKRSMRLLMVWVPFRLTGLSLESEESLMTDILGQDAAAALMPRLRSGAALEDVLDERWFSPTLARAGVGLSAAPPEDIQAMADVVMNALTEEHKDHTRQVALALYLGGVGMTIGVIVMVAVGLIFPILGASTNAF